MRADDGGREQQSGLRTIARQTEFNNDEQRQNGVEDGEDAKAAELHRDECVLCWRWEKSKIETLPQMRLRWVEESAGVRAALQSSSFCNFDCGLISSSRGAIAATGREGARNAGRYLAGVGYL